MKIVCISDTHGKHRDLILPEGDMLLHAGDITLRGEFDILEDFNNWLGEQNFKHKVVICGNHDFCFEQENKKSRKIMTNCTYLQDEFIEIEGLKIYGSPQTPWFHNWAFNQYRGIEIRKYWAKIPKDTNILITHGPPVGIFDRSARTGENVGCQDLYDEIYHRLDSLKLHVFGHIHEDGGKQKKSKVKKDLTFVNASCLNLVYEPINDIQVVEI